ncbi:hypothetical protein BD410DRAFT_893185 [Rickenella mellea]|uniref:N-acetyltransferase domain-containing protein n=1 Tax=Rickenella mellea TaxID=50990 RepID=A0A4R5XHR7_9AGAM|nr:hypothetical protein BD410DRAFT_893185 [Rickenella mellea]
MATSEPTIYVRRLDPNPGEDVIQTVTDVMIKAFDGDHFTSMLVCDQLELVPDCHRAQIRAGLLAGEVWVAGFTPDDILGAAVWFGPGQELLGGPNRKDQMELGWKTFQAKLSEDGKRVWWRMFLGEYCTLATNSLSRKHQRPDSWKFDSWHLQLLGVIPEHQRKGLGRALIEEIKKKADEQHLGMSVETETEKSLRFYKGVGFVEQGNTIITGYTDGSQPAKTSPMYCLSIDPDAKLA